VFPGSEDPAPDALRMLIGTFTIQGLATGTQTVAAVDPFAGLQSLTGPNPTTAPADGAHGEILIDPLLTQNSSTPSTPSLLVTVGVPEPGSLGLGTLAAVGLAAWRRRRTCSVATAAV
jgi:MYXO-CTERM domain-containing protein